MEVGKEASGDQYKLKPKIKKEKKKKKGSKMIDQEAAPVDPSTLTESFEKKADTQMTKEKKKKRKKDKKDDILKNKEHNDALDQKPSMMDTNEESCSSKAKKKSKKAKETHICATNESLDASVSAEVKDSNSSIEENVEVHLKKNKKDKKCEKRKRVEENGASSSDLKEEALSNDEHVCEKGKKKKDKKKDREAESPCDDNVHAQPENKKLSPLKKKKKKKKKDMESEDSFAKEPVTEAANAELVEVENIKKGEKKKKKSKKSKVKTEQDGRSDTTDFDILPKEKISEDNDDVNNADTDIVSDKPKRKKNKKRKQGSNEEGNAEVAGVSGDNINETPSAKKKKKKGSNDNSDLEVEACEVTSPLIKHSPKGKKKKKRTAEEIIDPESKPKKFKEVPTETLVHKDIKNDPKSAHLTTQNGQVKGQWASAEFENSEKQNKFLRLMGAFKKPGSENTPKKSLFGSLRPSNNTPKLNMALDKQHQQRLNINLEQQFDKALELRLNQHKGGGLGFVKPPEEGKKFYINTAASTSTKFD